MVWQQTFNLCIEGPIPSTLTIYAGVAKLAKRGRLKIYYDKFTLGVRISSPAPFAAVENWHIILTQNQAFVGSNPTNPTKPNYWLLSADR